MIRLTRILPESTFDAPEVYLDPFGVAIVVQHEGVTCVAMSGPQLLYNVTETPADVMELRRVWGQRQNLLDDPDEALWVYMDEDGCVMFAVADYEE